MFLNTADPKVDMLKTKLMMSDSNYEQPISLYHDIYESDMFSSKTDTSIPNMDQRSYAPETNVCYDKITNLTTITVLFLMLYLSIHPLGYCQWSSEL